MTSAPEYDLLTFDVSGVLVEVRIPSNWHGNTDRGWKLRGPQIKARLREKCRQLFGQGFLFEGHEGFKWVRTRASEMPEMSVLAV